MEYNCPNCGHRYDTQVAPGLKDTCPKCMVEFLRGVSVDVDSTSASKEGMRTSLPLAVGSTVQGMEILEFIGQGGMGYVYKARQLTLNRIVALKVLDPRLAAAKEFTSRFNHEAKVLAVLSHPNIVQVYDYGQEGELYFLAMELVAGTTLRQILSTQRLAPAAALRYVPQICDALEYAHAQGVIHRDIKPENILIDQQGNLKIADFGLAKMAAPEGQAWSHATATDRVMGTPHYMAPEQMKGMAAVDHRADIYSLGVVFYEMLTGELPIGRFPLPSASARVDVQLDEVVLKALEKDPERRYQQVSAVKEATRRSSLSANGDGKTELSPRDQDEKSNQKQVQIANGSLNNYTLALFLLTLGALMCLALPWGTIVVAGQTGMAAQFTGMAAQFTGMAAQFNGLTVTVTGANGTVGLLGIHIPTWFIIAMSAMGSLASILYIRAIIDVPRIVVIGPNIFSGFFGCFAIVIYGFGETVGGGTIGGGTIGVGSLLIAAISMGSVAMLMFSPRKI
jgi:tRNA A-37 threonylcarbamoyl transferase component Bud32